MNSVPFGEPLNQATLVLPDSLGEVGGDSYIQGAVPPAGEEIDAWLALWIPACAGTTKVMQGGLLLLKI